jgi:hypothetical protein
VAIIYSILAQESTDPKLTAQYQAKVQYLLTLESPGKELCKQLYAMLKAALPDKDKAKKQAYLDKAFAALGHPEVTVDSESSTDNASLDTNTTKQVHGLEIEDVKKFSVPQIDELRAQQTDDNQVCVEGYKGGKRVVRQSLETIGSPNMSLSVVAKDTIEFTQYGADSQGRWIVTYRWTGHEFKEVSRDDTNPDDESVKSAIDSVLMVVEL